MPVMKIGSSNFQPTGLASLQVCSQTPSPDHMVSPNNELAAPKLAIHSRALLHKVQRPILQYSVL